MLQNEMPPISGGISPPPTNWIAGSSRPQKLTAGMMTAAKPIIPSSSACKTGERCGNQPVIMNRFRKRVRLPVQGGDE